MDFYPYEATRFSNEGAYNNIGIWVKNLVEKEIYNVNKQPSTAKEKDFLERGGERIVETSNIYLDNCVDTAMITEEDFWKINEIMYKTIALDNRPIRNYCKIVVSRIDKVSDE